MHAPDALSDEMVRAAACAPPAGDGSDTGETLASTIAAARESLIRALTPQVRAMVLVRLAPNAMQASAVEDLTQEALLAISTGLPRLRNPTVAGLRAFASGIVANKVADWLRRAKRDKRGPPASLDSTIHALSGLPRMKDLLPASGLSVGSLAARAEAVAGVLLELGDLSERHREVITLAFFDQLTVNQIAERLGLSRPAASMLLLRAVRQLRRRLTGFSRVGGAHVRRT